MEGYNWPASLRGLDPLFSVSIQSHCQLPALCCRGLLLYLPICKLICASQFYLLRRKIQFPWPWWHHILILSFPLAPFIWAIYFAQLFGLTSAIYTKQFHFFWHHWEYRVPVLLILTSSEILHSFMADFKIKKTHLWAMRVSSILYFVCLLWWRHYEILKCLISRELNHLSKSGKKRKWKRRCLGSSFVSVIRYHDQVNILKESMKWGSFRGWVHDLYSGEPGSWQAGMALTQ